MVVELDPYLEAAVLCMIQDCTEEFNQSMSELEHFLVAVSVTGAQEEVIISIFIGKDKEI